MVALGTGGDSKGAGLCCERDLLDAVLKVLAKGDAIDPTNRVTFVIRARRIAKETGGSGDGEAIVTTEGKEIARKGAMSGGILSASAVYRNGLQRG